MFKNRKEDRIRAGWRILLFLVFGFLTAAVVSGFVPFGTGRFIVLAIASTLLVWMFGNFVDNRSFREFGMQLDSRWWKELALGTALGGGAILMLFAVAVTSGFYEITGWGWNRPSLQGIFWIGFSGYLLTMLLVGYYEEILFRGYLNLNLYEGLHTSGTRSNWIPALISIACISLLFGLAHANNPNATTLGIINVTLAGFMLGIPFLATGRLALSIGIHFAWNFVQGGIVGVPVSGIPNRFTLIISKNNGNELITGGAFGFEGGLLGTIGIVAILAGTIAWLYHIRAVKVASPRQE
ncbi:MAG: CPBP family intramembrane metalloprotease [Bacteroidetes bacterium]|nr:CPBP family intramembrane metalloprotease [Bacteroidota bacterium]MCH8524756.1 CPBP family intramembrane metalloprotease [Balneolales bacterium]